MPETIALPDPPPITPEPLEWSNRGDLNFPLEDPPPMPMGLGSRVYHRDIYEEFKGIYGGDVNKWWESTDPEWRKDFDAADKGIDDVGSLRAYTANRGLLESLNQMDRETTGKHYETLLADLAVNVGLKPDATDMDVYNAVSSVMQKTTKEIDIAQSVMTEGIRAAYSGTPPMKAWEDWSKGKTEVTDRQRIQMLNAWKKKSDDIDRVRPLAQRLINEAKLTLDVDWVKGVTETEFPDKMAMMREINSLSNEEFNDVLFLMQQAPKIDREKGVVQAASEVVGRFLTQTGEDTWKTYGRIDKAILEEWLETAPFVTMDEDKLKEGLEKGDPFAKLNAIRSPWGAIKGISALTGDKAIFMTPEERTELQQQVQEWGRFNDRVTALRNASWSIDDPKTGQYWHDLAMDWAQVGAFTGTTIATWYGGAALGMGKALSMIVSSQPLVGFFAEDAMQDMAMDARFDNIPYSKRVAIAVTAGEFESLVEQASNLVQFTRFGNVATRLDLIQSPLKRFGLRAFGNVGIEMGEEIIQEVSLPVATAVLGVLDDEIPEMGLMEKWGPLLTTENMSHLFMVVAPYALLGAAVKEMDPGAKRRLWMDQRIKADNGQIQAQLSNQEALAVMYGEDKAASISKKAQGGKVLEAWEELADTEVNPSIPAEMEETTEKKEALRSRIVEQGNVSEQEATAFVETADHIFRVAAAEAGVSANEMYDRIDWRRGDAVGDLEQADQEVNTRYMDLAKDPEANMEELRAMVDEAAKAAGLSIVAFRGDLDQSFTVFDRDKLGKVADQQLGFHFAAEEASAKRFSSGIFLELTDDPTSTARRVFLPGSLKFITSVTINDTDNVVLDIVHTLVNHDAKYAQKLVDDINQYRSRKLDAESLINVDKEELNSLIYNYLGFFGKGENLAYFVADYRQLMQQQGYKGVVYENTHALEVKKGEDKTAYIIFDPADIKSADPVTYDDNGNVIPLSERFGTSSDIRYQGRKGAIEFINDSKAIISLTEKGDISTLIHELGHWTRRYALSDKHQATLANFYIGEETRAWERAEEERFARDFERYFYDGQLPEGATSALKKAFAALKKMMREVYRALAGSPIGADIDPTVRQVLDELFTRRTDAVESDTTRREGLEMLGFINGADAEVWAKLGSVFGTNAERIAQQFADPKARKLRAMLLKDGEVPDFMRDALKLSEKRKSAVAQAFKNMALEYQRHLKKVPKANRAQTDDLANAALGGNQAALNSLPTELREVIIMARESIDILSKFLIDRGFLDEKIELTIGANLGTYLTRSYRIFDENSKWSKEVWTHANIIQAAEAELMSSGMTQQEAMDVMKEMTHPSRAQAIIFGGDKISGKIDITSFIKRQDLSKPIRDLLGERRNPIENMLITGSKLGRIISSFDMQEEVKRVGLGMDVFSAKKDPSKGYITQLFPNDKLHFTAEVPGVGDVEIFRQFKNKRMAGLRGVWTTPEIAKAITDYLEMSVIPPQGVIESLTRGWMKAIGIGKVAQVIWNTPSSLPSNLASSMSFEVFNGRVTPQKYAKGLGIKWAKGAYSLVDQDRINKMTGQDFLANDVWSTIPLKGIEQEMLARGALDENVFIGDMMAAIEASGMKLTNNTLKQVNQFLISLYQAPDNASKYNAFMWEANKWMKAEPSKSVAWAFDMAGRDVRATTQTYSEVNKAMRDLSRFGLMNTYMSFTHELIRNGFNTFRLAITEIRSKNPVLVKYGIWRMVSAGAFMAAIAAATRGLIGSIFDDPDDYEKLRRWAVAPWMDHKLVMPMSYNKDTKVFRYFDPSYFIPQVQGLDPFFAIARTDGDTVEKLVAGMGAVSGNFLELGILLRASAEVIANKEIGGGSIYAEGLSETKGGRRRIAGDVAEHLFKSAFRPGIMATIDRVIKAKQESTGAYGRVYSVDEEFWRLVAIRPITTDVQSLAASKLGEFHYRYLNANLQPGRQKSLSDEEFAELGELEEEARANVYTELVSFIRDMRDLGIDVQQARKDLLADRGIAIVRKDFFDKAYREASQ